MPARRRAVLLGESRGREAVNYVARELSAAVRLNALSYTAVGRDVGLSTAQVSRIARGLVPNLSIEHAVTLLASVGLDLSLRTFPTGRTLRDQAHLDLLERFRVRLHRSLQWRIEVPVRPDGDLRAWDATVSGPDWSIGVEAEVRLSDAQALERRLSLKQRDGSVDAVMLLVWATRHNHQALHDVGVGLTTAFPLAGARALELLKAGVAPTANALILL